MNTEYNALCRNIWEFYSTRMEELEQRLGLTLAHPLLPPPPRAKPVTILFVGLSPSLSVRTRSWFADTFEDAQECARQRRYVDQKSDSHTYPTYYGPLLKIAKLANKKFGLWHEEAEWLVEFTDLCHLPIKPNRKLVELFYHWPDVREHCKETLTQEIRLYKPRVVVTNGCETSDCVWKLWGEDGDFNPFNHAPIIHRTELGCSFHLNGFVTPPRPLDVYGQARLARELRLTLEKDPVVNH